MRRRVSGSIERSRGSVGSFTSKGDLEVLSISGRQEYKRTCYHDLHGLSISECPGPYVSHDVALALVVGLMTPSVTA
jgi:hypothetical protein